MSGKLDVLPSYKSKLEEEASSMLHNIKLGLGWSIAVRDLTRGVGFYIRLLNRYTQFKYTLTDVDRAELITLLIECITLPGDHDLSLLTKCMSALTKLIRKQKTRLNISWHFVYNLALKVIPFPTSTNESSFNGRIVEKHYVEGVARLAKQARKHYDESSSAQAIFAHFRPYFSPHDSITFTAQTLLVHLLPTRPPPSPTPSTPTHTNDLIQEVLNVWGWVNGVDEWDFQWVSLLSRWAKDQPDFDWSPYLSLIFQNFLRIFDLSLAGGGAILQPHKHHFPSDAMIHVWHHKLVRYASMAKLVAYMERDDGRVQTYLDQLFASVGSYFHPSNGGEWSEGLGIFLEYLCKYYAKRGSPALSEKFLASIERPLQYALYSKRHAVRASAVKAFMHLAYVAPSTLDTLLPRIYEALESETAAHQTRAVLEVLATIAHPLFSRTIYPKGSSHMALLGLTLPGIDANDVGKTTAAYKFYYRLLTTVPLIEGGDSSAAQSEHDSEAFSATYTFSDWAVSFVEQTLSFLSNKEDDANAVFQIVFEATIKQFFTQLSEPIFQAAVSKLFTTATTQMYPKSLKEVGFMCRSAANAQPALTLKTFIPFYVKTLVSTEGGKESLHSLSEDQLKWHLSMLSHVVSLAGAPLVQYEKQITSILTVSLASEEVKVYKAAHKLLRNLLHALVQYYPLDYRSENTDVWNSKDFQEHHWMRWGNTSPGSVAWHEPSTAEYEFAKRIIESTLAPAFSSLTTMATPEATYSRAIALQQLARLRAVLRGAAPVLRPAALAHTPPCSPEPRDHRGWCATVSPMVIIDNCPPQFLLGTVRESIANVVHQWCEFLANHKPDEIGPYKIICKIIYNLFTNYGVTRTKYQAVRQELTTLTTKWRNTKKLKTRNFIVAKGYLLHLARLNEDSFHTSSTEGPWTKTLLQDLVKLANNQYTAVRLSAQDALILAIRRHPLEIKPLVHSLLTTLSTTALENKDALTGVLHLLVAPTLMRKIAGDWTLRSELASTFVACLAHQQLPSSQQAQAWDHHTLAYFTRFAALSCVQSRSIPLSLPPIGPSNFKNIPAETLQKAQNTLHEHNRSNRHALHQIISTLTSVLDDKNNFNWKFKVMAVAQILWQARLVDVLTDENNETQAQLENVLRWLVRSMASDSPPLRSIASRFTASLLRTIKSPHPSPYKARNYQWWNQCTPTTPPPTRPAIPHTALAGLLATLCPEFHQETFVGKLVANLQEDHVFKASEEERGSGLDPMLAAAQRKFHFLGRFTDIASVLGQFTGLLNTQHQQDATSSLIGELLRTGRQWPYTRTHLKVEGFSTVNARLFKGLFKLFGTGFVNAIKPHVERLLSQSDRACQSTAAEILAGALRVAHKNNAESDPAWAQSVEWISASVLSGALGAPPECIIDWMACVRFGVYNLEPSRVTWLVEKLFASYTSSNTASSQAKPLYYIKAVLSELTWRAPSLHEKLINDLSGSLAHPYKQLRQEIGEIISLIIGFSWHPARDAGTHRPLMVPPTLPEYLTAFLHKSFAESNQLPPSDQPTTPQQATDENTARISHLRATLLHTTIHAFTQGHTHGLLPNLGPLVGPLFAAQTDPDHDVSRAARQACGIVAQGYHWPSSLSSLFPHVFPIGSSSSWRVRSALLPFLQILAYNNVFNIGTEEISRLFEFVISMLNDHQVEVRELARGTLSSLIKGISAAKVPKKYTETELSAHFLALIKGTERHAGVLGLAAIIGAHPYDLPQWMPDILVALAHQVGGKTSSITDTAKKGLMEFWRTHQDTWFEEQHQFTPEQRDALKERLTAPSYYA
eukprot:Phypoly_transcript_00239.p1 GENE.Phypoly_transcript_00239~~Phypoly_transcript_00239.p1  ORF type:complete len:1800 (+),score=287.16 Phypoly_transcript_00239:113-5512(+)